MFGFTHSFRGVFCSELFHPALIAEQPGMKELFNGLVWVKGHIVRRDPGFEQIDNDIPSCFSNIFIRLKKTAWGSAWVWHKRVPLRCFSVFENQEKLEKGFADKRDGRSWTKTTLEKIYKKQ